MDEGEDKKLLLLLIIFSAASNDVKTIWTETANPHLLSKGEVSLLMFDLLFGCFVFSSFANIIIYNRLTLLIEAKPV